MITTAQMYWIVTLDSIVAAGIILSFLFLLVAFGVFCACVDGNAPWWLLGVTALAAIVMIAVTTFTPSTRQMAAILIVPRIANSEKVQQAGNKLYELAVEWMDELKPSKEKAE